MSKSSAKAAAERLKNKDQEKRETVEAQPTNNDNQNVLEAEKTDEIVIEEPSLQDAPDDLEPQIDIAENGTTKSTEQSPLKESSVTINKPAPVLNTKPAETSKPKLQTNKLVQVEFISPYKRYSKGDIAAFSSDIAAELIAKKAAVVPGESAEKEEQEPV